MQHGGAHAAIHHDAGIGPPDRRDIYISAADADSFRAEYRTNPNAADPNAVLRIVDGPIASTGTFVPPIVALLDLLDAANTRALPRHSAFSDDHHRRLQAVARSRARNVDGDRPTDHGQRHPNVGSRGWATDDGDAFLLG